MIIHSNKIVTEQGIINGYLTIENGVITAINEASTITKETDIDYGDSIIIPGIFDTHNHGTMGWYPHNGEKAKEDIQGLCKALASQGITSIFPTCTDDSWEGILEVMKEGNSTGATIRGIHSEGPYLNRVGEKGVDTGHPEIDIDKVAKDLEHANGALKLMALAPELPNADKLIQYLTSHGVRCAFAHSNATYEEAMQSFKEGITVITHTGNVMAGIHHRNMGGLGAALLDDHVYNELICDGLHVRNEMIDIMFRIKHDAFHKFMMISDNVHLGGFPEGRYEGPFGATNITKEGFCLSDTGRLSGSTKPVIYGMKNLVENLGISLETVCQMSSLNPATVYGFADQIGSIRTGKNADIVVIDSDFNVLYTYVNGNIVYDHKVDKDLINHVTYDQLRIN